MRVIIPFLVLISLVLGILIGSVVFPTTQVSTSVTTFSTTIVSTVTNTTEPRNYTEIRNAFVEHLLAFESKNASLVKSGYESNATLDWGYFAGELSGLFNGSANIEDVYEGAFSMTLSLALTNVSIFSLEQFPNGTAFVNSSFSLIGNSTQTPPCSNRINATAIEEVYFSYSSNNRWLISYDDWIFNPAELKTGGPDVWPVCAE
jgi:hypothetical protein